MFKESRFAENQVLIFFNSVLVMEVMLFKSLPLMKILVSSANIIKVSSLVTVLRSLIYSKNRSGPKIEPCGTPHIMGNLIDRTSLR